MLIPGEKQDLDVAMAARDILEAGQRLVATHPNVGAVVLECTNMLPQRLHAAAGFRRAGL